MKTVDIVEGKIIELLDKGVCPWRQTWSSPNSIGEHKNFLSTKNYRGINQLMLWASALEREEATPYWMTFNQIKKVRGKLKKGSKGSMICFYKPLPPSEEQEEGEEYKRVLKYYYVFNLADVEGLDFQYNPSLDNEPIMEASTILYSYSGPKWEIGEPSYSPKEDTIYMPDMYRFSSSEEYYAAAYHEMLHSTGHHSRLNRPSLVGNAKPDRVVEELTAELGAAMLCATAKIDSPTLENQAAYIQSWSKQLKDKKGVIMKASAEARKGVDWVLDGPPNEVSADLREAI